MGFHFNFKGNKFMPKNFIFDYYIFATRCRRPLIFLQQRFKLSGCKDKGIRIFDKNSVPF